MESDAFFQEKVYLTPKDLRGDIQSIDSLLVQKLRQRLEKRCSPHGYVLPESIELLTRSTGMVDSGRFNGEWSFIVKAKARVLNPPEGQVVDVEIIKFNKMGIYAVYENAIRIMIPRDLHIGDDEFDRLKPGERIRVEIQKSRFQLRDEFIVSVGVYRGRSTEPVLAAAVAPTVPPGAVEQEMQRVEFGDEEEEEDEEFPEPATGGGAAGGGAAGPGAEEEEEA